MNESARSDLLQSLKFLSKRGEFTLASGKKSDWYLDCRPAMASTHTLRIAAESLVEAARGYSLPVLGGPATAAVAVMAAALTFGERTPTQFIYTRAKTKDHGTTQAVEGPKLGPDAQVLLVDDVLTSGGSLLKCADAIKAVYPDVTIVGAWVLVDREEGGRENLMEHGIAVTSLFTRTDIAPKA